MSYPTPEIDGWFESLEGAFQGKLPDDHTLIRVFGGQGWRVRTMGVELLVVADRDFPYSKPQAFIGQYDPQDPRPHIEPAPLLGEIARICLDTPTAPADPLGAVKAAFHDARKLLQANENGDEDGDFENDFGSYWAHYLPQNARSARLSLAGVREGLGAYFYYSKDDAYYCFPNKVSLRRFSKHLWNVFIREPHQFPVIELRRIPRPDRYPKDAEGFLAFLRRYSSGGMATVGALLRPCPRRLPVVFSAEARDGRQFKVAVELSLRVDKRGRPPHKAPVQSKLADEDVIRLYDVGRLDTKDIESSRSRLPDPEVARLPKTVVIVGCGALGSGVASLLAKSGVSRLVLIDNEILGWENIRRHELGAESVGIAKVDALKARLERLIPSLEEVVAYRTTLRKAIAEKPGLMDDVDLIVSTTGDWGCDVFLDNKVKELGKSLPVVYAWTEAYGLASHAVLISGKDKSFVEGFDVNGSFMGKASHTDLPPPAECGNSTSPFGAVEVAQSQALAARLALEALSGFNKSTVWRTWTAEESTVGAAEGCWTEYWLREHGTPPRHGGITESDWSF
ncbi:MULTISPECIES: ThiF family adenylyltransferase [Rhizobium]|uniref:Uncharacterized protein n=1 Tax=Rhizobium tropici TaxID=398 RepID=A0A329YE67_RHITR|nr:MULTISPECIES: ThiF family adenylyltransferase [Rhizobium]MBX4913661.1 hypothetical protein [Rhizobium bangladeshense]RAX42509.1 hypothetical protein DQ393_06750 [Rhizobium tropici]